MCGSGAKPAATSVGAQLTWVTPVGGAPLHFDIAACTHSLLSHTVFDAYAGIFGSVPVSSSALRHAAARPLLALAGRWLASSQACLASSPLVAAFRRPRSSPLLV